MNSKIRVGVIGAGYWGPNLVRNFIEVDGSELIYVCDLSKARREYINSQWPDIKTAADYHELLRDKSVDAIVIATPVETHFDIAMNALKAGKHVFIEKPMTYSDVDDSKLLDIAEQLNLRIGTGHIYIYHPAVNKIKELLREQKIGKPYYAYSTRMNPAPSRGNVEVIWDLAVHDVSIALYLWDQKPVKVRASGGTFAHDGRIDVATVELYFPDGTMTYHHVGWLTSAKERRFFLAGTKGSIKFDEMLEEKLWVTGPVIDTRKNEAAQTGHIYYAPGKTEAVKLSAEEPLRKECEDFIRSVSNGGIMKSDGKLGHSVVKVLETATASARNGGQMMTIG